MFNNPHHQETGHRPQRPNLLAALLRLAELQREPVDRLALQEAVQHVCADDQNTPPKEKIARLTRHLGLKPVHWLKTADPSQVPALVHDPMYGWGVLVGKTPKASGCFCAGMTSRAPSLRVCMMTLAPCKSPSFVCPCPLNWDKALFFRSFAAK